VTLLVALLLAAAPAGPSPVERFERANALYRAGDFSGAASGYEALAKEGFASSSLLFNLGNAQRRLGLRGPAIVSWERALRLDPWDEDALANLRAERRDDPDRALAGEPTFLARVVARTRDGVAALLFLAAWWVLWGALALRRRASGRARRALGALALLSSLGVLSGGALVAGRARDRRLPFAILAAPSSPVREGPSLALRSAFELHEGTRVRILSRSGDFVRVRLEGGLEGWIAARDLEPL
jgi:tetratricopeptide (TPR) repeat protein